MAKNKLGLALSGGGFRATLFHIGSLWRLNELGLLEKLDRVCSVSGGSIIAGYLGYRWKDLTFTDSVATNFDAVVAEPLQNFCTQSIDTTAGLEGLVSLFDSIGERVEGLYRAHLFGDATLQDLPSDDDGPRFIIYATNLQTGASFRFSRPYMADYTIGQFDIPKVPLAKAVAASSAFPPVLSPVILETDKHGWKKVDGASLHDKEELRSTIYLTDGGVYDNMGLEAVWDNCETVLVSDAGAPLAIEAKPSTVWHNQLLRCIDIITDQTRALRKRKLVADYQAGLRKGTYWGITTNIDDYATPEAMVKDNPVTRRLQEIRTRLNPFTPEEQGQLINWGYALADAAIRRWVNPAAQAPTQWPIPDHAL